MPDLTEALQIRQAGWRTLVGAAGWGPAIQELLSYADKATEPAVRAGRYDVIGFMLRAAGGTGNLHGG